MARRKVQTQETDYGKRLAELKQARAEAAAAKKVTEEAKDELLDYVQEMGLVPFIDEDGNKVVAYFSDSEMTIVDIDELLDCVDEGLVGESVLELIAPRVPDLDALAAARAANRIPKEAAKRFITFERSRPTIRFRSPEEGDNA